MAAFEGIPEMPRYLDDDDCWNDETQQHALAVIESRSGSAIAVDYNEAVILTQSHRGDNGPRMLGRFV